MNDFPCLKDQCRSPLACHSFGYCRERNFDGCPMDQANVDRRRRESEAASSSVKQINEKARKRG